MALTSCHTSPGHFSTDFALKRHVSEKGGRKWYESKQKHRPTSAYINQQMAIEWTQGCEAMPHLTLPLIG